MCMNFSLEDLNLDPSSWRMVIQLPKHCHSVFSVGTFTIVYVNVDKRKRINPAQRKSNLTLIEFSILRHVFYLIFNFVASELLCENTKKSKSN